MKLIGEQDVNATSYKKAAVIMFNNTGTTEMNVYEDTVIPLGDTVITQRTGQYTVPYHPDIEIPLPDDVLALLANIQTAKTLGIDALMGVLYAVYRFSREYQPLVIEEAQPNGNN